MDLASNNRDQRQTGCGKTYSSAPSSANLSRRKHPLRASLRVTSDVESESNGPNIRRDRVAWQTIWQQLTLQLEQKRRFEITRHRRQLDEEHKNRVNVSIDEAQHGKVGSRPPLKINLIKELEFLI